MSQLLVTANVVPSSPILVTLMMEARRGILHSNSRENLNILLISAMFLSHMGS
jgi:hypothetical protein